MSNDELQKDTKYPLLPAKYYDVFGLRIIGLTYKQIADKTGYSESWLRRMFARGGVLYEFWRNWVEDYKKESVDEALDMMFGHLPDAVRSNIIDAKTTGNIVGIAARKMLFEYTLGKPEDRLKIDAKVGVYTFADWIKAETLKEKENAKSTNQQGEIPKQYE